MKKYCVYLSLISVLLVNSACTPSSSAPIVDGWHQKVDKQGQGDYIVQSDDTLYSIAWAFDLDFRDLAKINHISPPYKLHAGQHLKMLAENPHLIPAAHISNLPIPSGYKSSKQTLKKNKSRIYRLPAPASENFAPISAWMWPAKGKVVAKFTLADGGNRGIDIAGKLGEAVVASAPGRVVYSGSGLRGYGNLLIIKHNDDFLSAYAYNRKLLVKEGTQVKAGQIIALMGANNAGQVRLHFEIRQNGKPINPLSKLQGKH